MGQWISSKEFAESFNINKKSLEKACFRANQSGKKISSIRSIIINFTYTNGIGGNAGKILQIWNTPLSQKQVEAIEKGYPIKYVLEEMGEVVESANTEKHICSENSSKDAVESRDKTTQPNVMESKDSKALACKENKMEEKGANNEKALKENSREALHTRGNANASECNSRAIVSSNSSLYRNNLPNGGVVESARVNESMERFKQSPSNEEVVESNNDEVAQPNVMESKDSKALGCKENKMEEKGANNEKALKENSREALHTRGHNNVSECSCMGSGNPTLYRNDLPNGGVVESARVDESMESFKQSPRNDEVAKRNVCESMDCFTNALNDEVVGRNDKAEKHNDATTWHNLTPNQKAQAKQRERILQDYESAKLSGIAVKHFIELKNREDSTLKLTQGKLFDWARKYKTQGLSALSDKRGIAKTGITSLPVWVQDEAIKMWRVMGSGYLNRMQLWRELHIIAHLYVEGYSYEKFLKCEIPPLFSLNTLNRFLDSYLKANSLEYTLITYGTDKTDSYKEPAYGMQRDLYTLPNQLWQIDSSPLDAIVLDNDGKQIRPSILSVIDVYSGRNVAYLSETSDSNAVIRLMWKAFESMGKPQAIQFDNGKDYLSNKVQGLLDGLNIVFVRSAAYKGKAKAVVERRFRTIQGSYITAITSYIGRNGNERSAREQQTPKKERKSKDALGNPLKTQG